MTRHSIWHRTDEIIYNLNSPCHFVSIEDIKPTSKRERTLQWLFCADKLIALFFSVGEAFSERTNLVF